MTVWNYITENWIPIATTTILSIPITGAAAWAFGSKFAEKWLDTRFTESLQRMKHEQDITIAKLKVEVDSVLAARMKIQGKEFDVTATAWEKMSDVMVSASSVMSPLKLRNDMSHCTDEDWEDIFSAQKIAGGPRRDVLAAKPIDRNRIYNDILDRSDIYDANVAISELRIFIKKFGLFIPKEIGDEMESLALLLKPMMNNKSSWPTQNYQSLRDDLTKYSDEFLPPYEGLFSLIRDRLSATGRMSHPAENKVP